MANNLVIVESPAKAKTIEKYLGKDYIVKSCNGHVRDLAKKDLGIEVKKNFTPVYEISKDKKQLVADLKKLSDKASIVWLATDEDREGEAISWHLVETLKIDIKKTKRIVFHEITKNAILKAIETPRELDINLVNAQQARRILDRLVGFELSPLLWKKVRPALSAGRVQSVAVRILVEREKEINSFTSKEYYKVVAEFEHKKSIIKAELSSRFEKKEEALKFLEQCKKANFKVENIEVKPIKRSPAPPFTTSTLQQEASRKLGYSVAQTMRLAQQLYEEGHITYMRTDSVNLSKLALDEAKREIISVYGDNYSKTRNFTTKTKGAQEAHEAIRPTSFENKTIDVDRQLLRLYELIWKRSLASQMTDALIEKTSVTISISNNEKYNFIVQGEVIKFDGFIKVYVESFDDEDEDIENTLPKFDLNQELKYIEIQATQKYTSPPARYAEASLVRKLEEIGIGRPSTYAPTISTIQKRGYVVKQNNEGKERDCITIILTGGNIKENKNKEVFGKEKGKLIPTDIGIIVTEFLSKEFPKIMDYNFTAKVEEEFDIIAMGDLIWNDMISNFYKDFHKTIETVSETAEKVSGERLLGIDPASKENVYAKIGRFGPIIQIGDKGEDTKPKFASIINGLSIQNITLEEALELFKLPRTVGVFEEADIISAVGKFGPYIRHNSSFYSLGKLHDPLTIDQTTAIEIILEKRKKDKEKVIKIFEDNIQVLNGRYGPYIYANKKNYKIPKKIDAENIKLEECLDIIKSEETKKPTKPTKPIKKAK